MSDVIVRMEMPKNCAECKLQKPMGICPITDCYALVEAWRDHRPGWCPIIGELPEQHGDLIYRDETAEKLNQMADEVYEDFPLVDRETLASWDHGIRMAALYVLNLAGRKDEAVIAATERSET